MISRDEAEALIGRPVRDRDGAKLGRLKHVHLAPDGGRATWGVVARRGGARRLVPLGNAGADAAGVQVSADRAHVRSAPSSRAGDQLDPVTEAQLERHYASLGALTETRTRQREAYGGFKLGSAVLGWIVATGLATILVALLGAAGTAIGVITDLGKQAQQAAASTGIGSAAVVLAVLVVAYYIGGYVAGRLARFDGGRNGFGAWLVGVVVTAAVTVVAVVAGDRYDVLVQLSLPSVPLEASALAPRGLLTLVVIVVGTLGAALLGGKAGERFHYKVDRAGVDP